MITTGNLGALMGAPVLGPDDEKIGTVGQLFVDPATGNPNWVTVKMGIFGKESFVPLDTARWDHEHIRISFDKEKVKGAPRIETQGPLTEEQEAELYSYYGLAPGEDNAAPVRRGAHAADVEPDLPPSTGVISTVGAHVLREPAAEGTQAQDDSAVQERAQPQEDSPAQDGPAAQENSAAQLDLPSQEQSEAQESAEMQAVGESSQGHDLYGGPASERDAPGVSGR